MVFWECPDFLSKIIILTWNLFIDLLLPPLSGGGPMNLSLNWTKFFNLVMQQLKRIHHHRDGAPQVAKQPCVDNVAFHHEAQHVNCILLKSVVLSESASLNACKPLWMTLKPFGWRNAVFAFDHSTPGVPWLPLTNPLGQSKPEDGAVHPLRKASRNARRSLALILRELMPRRWFLAWGWPTT